MNRLSMLTFLIAFIVPQFSQANCDLTRFRWDCEAFVHTKPKSYATSLVQCGHVFVYVTKAQYETIARYQRANLDMHMMINNEYIDGSCIPIGK